MILILLQNWWSTLLFLGLIFLTAGCGSKELQGAFKESAADQMVLVFIPAGPFVMGSDERDEFAADEEKPHGVFDKAGSVREWTTDRYIEQFYQ